jgi:hypothetical protein
MAIFTVFLLLYSSPLSSKGLPRARSAAQLNIISWANITPEWQRTLHVSGLRLGCSSPPQSCMKYMASLNSPAKAFFLAILLKPDTAVGYAAQYSALSSQLPALQEIGLDDFVSQYAKLSKAGVADPPAFLSSFIDGIKSLNRNLRFGATIYEDELAGDSLGDKNLPPALRAKFDTVHFFIHFRGNTPKYADYVQQVKRLFPNAQVVAGIYPYDRISYVPCLPKGQPCSPEEEFNYFNQSLDTAMNLLQQGTVSWIEFFPGIFGHEDNWNGWSAPRLCPGRLSDCVANTKKMTQSVAAKISGR